MLTTAPSLIHPLPTPPPQAGEGAHHCLGDHEIRPKTLTARPFPPIRPPAPCKDREFAPVAPRMAAATRLGLELKDL